MSRLPLAILLATSFFISSCKNMFGELAQTDTDAAIFYDAKLAANTKDYDSAIALVGELSSGYAAQREVQVFLASAYAGRCGMDYLSIADAFIHNTASDTPMEIALKQMKGSTSEADCKTAESILRAISPAGDGIMSDNLDDAFLMAFVGIAKVGAILERLADTSDHDGVVDAGFDSCAIADADARELGTGITLMYNNIKNSGTAFAAQLSAMTSLCALSGGMCDVTDPTAFTAPAQLDAVRGVFDNQTVGIGSDPAYPACP